MVHKVHLAIGLYDELDVSGLDDDRELVIVRRPDARRQRADLCPVRCSLGIGRQGRVQLNRALDIDHLVPSPGHGSRSAVVGRAVHQRDRLPAGIVRNVDPVPVRAVRASEEVCWIGRLEQRIGVRTGRTHTHCHTRCLDVENSIAEDCRELVSMLSDTAVLDAKIETTKKEIDEIVAGNNRLIRGYAVSGDDNASFDAQTADYDARFKKADAHLRKLKKEREDCLSRSSAISEFIETMLEQPLVLEKWDEQLWCQMMEKAVISSDGTVTFTFRGENSITVRIE